VQYISTLRYLARFVSGPLLAVAAFHAQAFDTYNTQTQQLSVPTVKVGSATFTNMVVGVSLADIVVAPSGSSADTSVDAYNPLTNQLTIPTVVVGSTTFHNVVVTVGNLVSVGGVTGADTYNASLGEVTIPVVQVGGVFYTDALITIGAILSHGGGMPKSTFDIYNASSHQLTIEAIQVGGTVYTNAIITPGTIKSVAGQTPAESVLYSFGGNPFSLTASLAPLAGLIQALDGNFYGTASGGGAHGAGTVFKITPAGVESIVYSFGANGAGDGALASGNLMQGSDGTFYGTTLIGGTSGQGTVFKVTPQGAESVLYSFTGGNDGGGPESNLVLDSEGNLYGTASGGGTHNDGTVFKLTPQGTETVLWSFSGTTDGSAPAAGLTLGRDGNYYGTTFHGGQYGGGTIFRITPTGTLTSLHTFGGTSGEPVWPYGGLILGQDGNFYGATINDENATGGAVYRMTPAGAVTILHQFTGLISLGDAAVAYAPLVEDVNGNFYGTTLEGGIYGVGAVYEITAAGTELVLYSFTGGGAVAGSTDGMGPECNLVLGTDGNMYGLTTGGGVNGEGTVFRLLP
jgi:uncharacterized repeat protein (TIGR03803 family)